MNPLLSPPFLALPLGSIAPRGWLLDQLRLQADGLTGHLDEFWPPVKDSRWIGGQAEGWERGPYWLDGLVPLAFLIDDERLKAKAKRWVDAILSSQHPDGWLGAKDDAHEGEGIARLDPWPLFVLFKAFLGWHDATGDERIVPALLRCARRVQLLLGEEPLRSWAKLRWADFVWSLHRLFELSGEAWLLDLGATCRAQGFDWDGHFAALPAKTKTRADQLGEEVGLPLHGVNNAMGLKTGAVWWRQSGREQDLTLASRALKELDLYHGAASGMFNADEHLAGLSPSQGFETCAVVEEMFSLEVAGAASGEAALFDRLEQIAFNALPASCASDMWSHQYHQQTNQVACTLAPRAWTDSGPRANLFGQDVHFGCCQANLHQGWPKFAASLWMHFHDDAGEGLAAVAYAPCHAKTRIGGVYVEVEETTDYPFRGDIILDITVETPVEFALRLRIPAWAQEAQLELDGQWRALEAGGFHALRRGWSGQTRLVLRFAMPVRAERRERNTLALHRGPLLLALPLEEEWRALGSPYVEQEPRAQEWELLPHSAWNYALDVEEEASDQIRVSELPLSRAPFAALHPPVRVRVPARRLREWKERLHSAGDPPCRVQEEVHELAREEIELVPYGCARLRVAQFPVVK